MRVGTLLGVPVSVNPFFLLLLLGLSFTGLLLESLIFFGIVLVHETAHALTARAFGLKVREIELLPFGGITRIDDIVEGDPLLEARVAFAGPLSNLALTAVSYAAIRYQSVPYELAWFIIRANLTLAGFNMVPAIPLDGGRILRAYLARRIGYRRATDVAARLGKLFAFLFASAGVAGVYWGRLNLGLVVVGAFVYIAARKEEKLAAYVFMRYLVKKKRELYDLGVLRGEHLVVCGDVSLKHIVRQFIPKKYHLVVILDRDGKPESMTSEVDVVEALFSQGIDTPVSELQSRKL